MWTEKKAGSVFKNTKYKKLNFICFAQIVASYLASRNLTGSGLDRMFAIWNLNWNLTF